MDAIPCELFDMILLKCEHAQLQILYVTCSEIRKRILVLTELSHRFSLMQGCHINNIRCRGIFDSMKDAMTAAMFLSKHIGTHLPEKIDDINFVFISKTHKIKRNVFMLWPYNKVTDISLSLIS